MSWATKAFAVGHAGLVAAGSTSAPPHWHHSHDRGVSLLLVQLFLPMLAARFGALALFRVGMLSYAPSTHVCLLLAFSYAVFLLSVVALLVPFTSYLYYTSIPWSIWVFLPALWVLRASLCTSLSD